MFSLSSKKRPANPTHKLKRNDLASNKDAGRNLDDAELRAVWAAADSPCYPFGPWVKMLMLTGQRRGEWAKAQRGEIDVERRLLEILAARHKSGRDHIVPLVGRAWAVVEALPVLEGDYLFSTRAGKVAIGGFSRAKRMLDELAPLATWRFHDLRVTCETRMAGLGITHEVRDAVLAHARPGLQKIYNKHDYADEKRAALDAYATHLMEVVG